MASESSRLESLRQLAESQGVAPSDEDLEAVLSFLDTILPELARIEEALPPDAVP